MRHIAIGVDADAPAEAVWELISRFEHWATWGTTIRAVETPADEVAPGVTGRVLTVLGIWVPFEITHVDEGRSWMWNVAGRSATGHHVAADGPGRSRVELTVAWPLAPYLVPMWFAARNVASLAEAREERS